MQTAFINNIPLEKLSDVAGMLKFAPGFLSSETLLDKNTGNKTGVIFCHFEKDFKTFKKFLEAQPNWISSITIQEGMKL